MLREDRNLLKYTFSFGNRAVIHARRSRNTGIDLSHGSKKRGLTQELKDLNWIVNLIHLAQSPDLNLMEAIWNILKQRVRRRTWRTIIELKEILQEEWSKITMQEVCTRISDMPRRCRLLVETGGKTIKSAQW
jgi:hypothetical protein